LIVFAMNGRYQRFHDAGYERPKYMLDLHGKSVFAHVVEGFKIYFGIEQFLFIHPENDDVEKFIVDSCRDFGLDQPLLCPLKKPTQGQAETVSFGLENIGADPRAPLSIFNIDTIRRNISASPTFDGDAVDGYLEVFRGAGDNWSFVRSGGNEAYQVIETTEKKPISDLCCTGLYHFRPIHLFQDAFEKARSAPENYLENGEYYVAPLYNHLINDGADIRYHLIKNDDVSFCGTPEEYESLSGQQDALK